jgi:N-acetylglucosamine kinase-like BadF-type ATPase
MIGFVGIDGGGTKTRAILINERGEILGEITGPSTNPSSSGGVEQSMARLHALMKQLYHQTAHFQIEQHYIFAGMSGMSEYGERGLNVLKEYSTNPVVIWDHDGVNALYSGTFGKPGGVLVTGTGSVAFALSPSGNRIQVGGWGHWLGDEGSGFAMGRLGLKRIMEAWDERGSPTLLTEAVLRQWALKTPTEIIPYIYVEGGKEVIASIAPLIFEVAEQGDEVAIEIINEIGKQQVSLIKALLHRLSKERWEEAIPIVLVGGLFQKSNWFLGKIEQELAAADQEVKLILPQVPPVVGAVVAALKLAPIPQDQINRMMNQLKSQIQ